MTTAVRHPAKFTDAILEEARLMLDRYDLPLRPTLYDPFAGTGKGVDFMREHGWDAYGTELEAEWAAQSRHVDCCDSLDYMRNWSEGVHDPMPLADVVFTSPAYGNRMADHHEAKDTSKRNTYRHALGRPLSEGSAAGMQWGDEYRRFHTEAWARVYSVLRPGGYFLLNVKDHIRKGDRQDVAGWHMTVCRALGFLLRDIVHVPVPGFREGANGALRVDEELLVLFRKPA